MTAEHRLHLIQNALNPEILSDHRRQRDNLPSLSSFRPYIEHLDHGRSELEFRRQTAMPDHRQTARTGELGMSRYDTFQDIPPTSSSDAEGFSHAIEVLRHDGLSNARSRQLLSRYHRERSTSSTRREPSLFATAWDSIDRGTERSQGGAHHGDNTLSNGAGGHAFHSATSEETPWIGRSRTHEVRNRPTEQSLDDRLLAARARLRGGRPLRRPTEGRPMATGLHDYIGPVFRLGRRDSGLRGALGDYVVSDYFPVLRIGYLLFIQRDEDFDASYENLISLATALGDAKPRATPESVIAGLESSLYKNWATHDSDRRCPICLDDVCICLISRLIPLTHHISINPMIPCSSSTTVHTGCTRNA